MLPKPLNRVLITIFLVAMFVAHPAMCSLMNPYIPVSPLIIKTIKKTNPQLSDQALLAGIRAYAHLRAEGKDNQQLLTLINFNRPSNKKRLWVFNMRHGKTLYFTYVAHGQRSGFNIAKHFSNALGSHKSSIGVYLTGQTYYGIAGHSLRLQGLDKGFNSHAFKRHIVMHPAWYVSQHFAQTYGRIGRTYGCFGLNKTVATQIIPMIKDGTVMVAYYPDKIWLATSPYERPLENNHFPTG